MWKEHRGQWQQDESMRKTARDEPTFAFALRINLGVSESSLMFTVSE